MFSLRFVIATIILTIVGCLALFMDARYVSTASVYMISEQSQGCNKNITESARYICYKYTDNLYHLTNMLLGDVPIHFRRFERIPHLQSDMINIFGPARRCSSSTTAPSMIQSVAGPEYLLENMETAVRRLESVDEKCQSRNIDKMNKRWVKNSNLQIIGSNRSTCLHLIRTKNRILRGCRALDEQCDVLSYSDRLGLCAYSDIFKGYQTIISAHGFQITLAIILSIPGTHIVEARWAGFGGGFYDHLSNLFKRNYTTVRTYSIPQGKFDEIGRESESCLSDIKCRKYERKKDMFCSVDSSQEAMKDAISIH